MPYTHEKCRLPRELDRRVKLTDNDKKNIVELYSAGNSIRSIATKYEGKCCRRMIQFVLFPERIKAANRNRDWTKYYNKEKNSLAVKKTRQHKQEKLKPIILNCIEYIATNIIR